MAVLVSGASGFLGSRLVARLVAIGKEVVAVARRSAPVALLGNPRVRWLVSDIARDGIDTGALPEIEVVVHLAGATLGAGADESHFLRANEQTTVRLCQALAARCPRFVFASSQVVYGDARDIRVSEDFPLRPDASAYACSKVNSENWLRWFQKCHGGQYFALRFCGFIDGGGMVDYVIERALAGAAIELYSQGMVRRDYLPSSAAIDVFAEALQVSVAPGFVPINIGSGQSVSAQQVATLICSTLRSSSRIELSTKPSPQGDFVFCIERARQLLHFEPGSLTDAVCSYALQRQKHAHRGMSDA